MRRNASLLLGFALLLAAVPADAADHKFVGAKKCRACHADELMGDQYGAWKQGEHAQAFKTLRGDKAAEIAGQAGIEGPAHEAPECLRCHVTAYEAEDLAIKYPIAPEAGVQCESCHGPGSDYRKKKIMSDRKRFMAKGMWEPGKNEEICTACHNSDSPTTVPFDYDAAKEKISHPIPPEVKGNYLALDKERKAAERKSGKK